MAQGFDYDTELDDINLEIEDSPARDNFQALERALVKIQDILEDINARLNNGGL